MNDSCMSTEQIKEMLEEQLELKGYGFIFNDGGFDSIEVINYKTGKSVFEFRKFTSDNIMFMQNLKDNGFWDKK